MDKKFGFYDDFQCIAGECSFTCCQQWKIAVDEKTYEKWEQKELNGKRLSETVVQRDGMRMIGLDGEKKCPFLNHEKLCEIVCRYGEDILSETCHTFPRQIHDFPNHKEYAVVTCCPEVIDLLRKQGKINIDSISHDKEEGFSHLRRVMMENLLDEEIKIEKAMLLNSYLILDCMEKWERKGGKTDDFGEQTIEQEKVVENALSKIENDVILDAFDRIDADEMDKFCECNEIFLDMVDNYRKEGIYEEQIEPLALLAEQMESVFDLYMEEDEESEEIEEGSEEEIEEMIQIDFTQKDLLKSYRRFVDEMESYDVLLRNILVNDLFSDFLLPEASLQDLVVMSEWKSLCFVAMRQMLFLKWYQNKKLTYEQLRECVVIIERMTGYDMDDIEEYMENSFESLIWPLGYVELIL